MPKCPKCRVTMSRGEFKAGSCDLCGWERSRQERLAERKRTTKSQSSAPAPAPKVESKKKKVEIVSTQEMCISPAGYIKGTGFSVSDANVNSYRAFIDQFIIETSDGKVWVGNSILATVGDTHTKRSAPNTVLKVGRAKLYQVTESIINDLMKRNDYPRRSQREREVQERNNNIIWWLVEAANIG